MNFFGGVLRHRNNYSKALEFYKMSNALFQKHGSEYREYINLGHLLYKIGDLDAAKTYYSRYIQYCRDSLPPESTTGLDGMAWGNLHVGRVIIGDSSEEGLRFMFQAINLWEKAGEEAREQGAMAYAYSLIARYYLDKEDLPRARQFADSVSVWVQNEDIDNGSIELLLAQLYFANEQFNSALDEVNFAIDSTRLTNYDLAYLIKSKTLAKLGDYKNALKYKNAEDSLRTIATKNFGAIAFYREQNSLNEMKYEQELHRQEQQEQRNYLIGGGLFLALLSFGLIARMRFINRSRKLIALERDRSDDLLLNILPAEIADELKKFGHAEARDFDQATILFTDFKQFTEASEKYTAKELVEEINVIFKAFDQISEKYSIEKIKTIGDSYMAAAGLPVPDAQSTRNCVMTGIEMQAFMLQRQQQRMEDGKHAFKMRVGLHTGPVVAGIVGVKKFQYDLWGDTVNTASRMESHGEVDKVNISQSTYNLIKEDPMFTFESRGKVEAKGKGEVEMYFVSLA